MKKDATSPENLNTGHKSGGSGKARFSHDSFWKDLVGDYFYPLLKRALPGLYKEADVSVRPRPLDKEFTDVLKTANPKEHKSPRFADFVMEVPLKDGPGKWVLFHCESQQGHGGGDLTERMFFYQCLIYAHYP